jgi:hypothetical protein
MKQLDGLVESGNTVVAVEHDMAVAATSDCIIDIGPEQATRAAGQWLRDRRRRSRRNVRAERRSTLPRSFEE